jgi:hypothetical protein
MKQIKFIIILIVLIICFSNGLQAQNQTKIDSLKQSFEQTKEVYNKGEVLHSTRIRVLSTCSTKLELCGIMAFSSVGLVQIIEGEYIGDIYVMQGDFRLIHTKESKGVLIAFTDKEGNPKQYMNVIEKGALNFLYK